MAKKSAENLSKSDSLLVNIGRSIVFKATVISIILHAVLMGGTSIGLIKDWQVYGIKSPSQINAIRTAERKEAEDKKRKAEAAERAKKEAAAAEEARKIAATNKVQSASAATGELTKDGKKPPEVQPLPPKKEFEYGDDLSLD